MAVLRRLDGVQFAINPYRTTIEFQNGAQLTKTIKTLTLSHGQNIRLFKTSDNHVDAVMSLDPGFLLGESVWQHFECPQNLIYCELMPENMKALLVIVTEGKVAFDNLIAVEQIVIELPQHIDITEKYAIYTYGDVPIAVGNDKKSFNFKDNNIASFNHLSEPLFIHLPVNDQLQLMSMQSALTEHHFTESSIISRVGLLLLIIMAFSSWYATFYLH